MDLTLI
ncbi:unnamed protein product [Larinioides sclopetarius]